MKRKPGLKLPHGFEDFAEDRNGPGGIFQNIISMLASAPDGMLATPLAQECKNFIYTDDAQALKFLRNLRSKAVYTGGAAPFVMHAFQVICDNPPESEEDRKARQAELEREWFGGEG